MHEIIPSTANFVMCHLGPEHPTAAVAVREARRFGVYLRDVSSMGQSLGWRALRIAVKTEETNFSVLRALENALLNSSEWRRDVTPGSVRNNRCAG